MFYVIWNRICIFRLALTGVKCVKCLAIAALAVCLSATAQEPQPTATGETSKDNLQTIYIPYEQLQDVFEREGRGVFLPYDQFQKLWKEARTARKSIVQDTAPVGAILVAAENTATVENAVLVVRAKITVELLRSGWHKIPLQLNDAAILSAKIDNEPARILFDQGTGYSLLFQSKAPKASSIQVELEYAKDYEKTPGQNSVSIMAPQAPINRWRIRVPESGVQVKVEPMLATTEPDPPKGDSSGNATGTEVLAFVGAVPSIRIRWVPKSEGATGMAPLASVQTQHRTLIEEGMMSTTAQFAYTIDRSELSQLTIAIPSDQKVINVFDPNVRKWSIDRKPDKQDSAQQLVVELFEPARQTQNLVVELESTYDSKAGAMATIQPLVCLDTSRQQGVVAIRIGQGLRAEPLGRKGLMQLDPAELPPPLAKQAWTFAYRFTQVPFELNLKLTTVTPTIRVEQLVEVIIEPQALTLELSTSHKIENAGVFQLEYEIPEGYELLQVAGRSGTNLEAASIDTYRFTNEAKDRLVVDLQRRAVGNIGTLIQLRKKLIDPNLIAPTGIASSLSIPIPRASGEYIQWTEGLITINAPESLRINPTERVGVRDGVPAEARAAWTVSIRDRYPTLSEVMVFAHAMEPVKLKLEVERKRPFVSVRQLLHAMIEPGSVKFTSSLFTQVQYSSIPSIRIDVPELIARDIRVETAGIRERTINPTPPDVEPGYVAWELIADTPWIGERTVQLGWTARLSGLEIGKSVQIELPRLIPRDTDRSWGQIVLNRTDSLDIQSVEGNSGLRPIDPRYDLMPEASHPDAARAFEFQGEWTLKIGATRYAIEQVKQTSIERAFVRAVVTRSNRIGIHAIYRMRNATQRLALKLHEAAEFDSQPLLINGQSASLERGDGKQLFIPLAGYDVTQSLIVELRYTIPGDHKEINIPSFPNVPAVQTVYLGVFLPKERLLLSSQGPWTEEFELRRSNGWRAEPVSYKNAEQLMAWVKDEDVGNRRKSVPGAGFQADGVMYLYSTLRPEDSAAGSLRLRSMDQRWWAGAWMGILLLMGLLFCRSSFQIKFVVVALVLAAFISVGVFAPTIASQLMNAPVYIGALLVSLLWGTHALITLPMLTRRNQSSPGRPPTAEPLTDSGPGETDAKVADQSGGNLDV